MEKIRFNCGDYLPGKRPSDPIIEPIPISPIKIPAPNPCCTRVPGFPALPEPPIDEWTCICEAPCADDPNQCLEARGCIRRSQLRVGQRHGRFFPSYQACVDQAFNEAPCWKCGVKCVETIFPCPPPFQNFPKLKGKDCIACPPAREQTGDCARFASIRDCRNNCREERFNCPTIPTNPDIPGPGPGPITPAPPVGGGGGPITPTSWFKCVQRIEYCPPPREEIQAWLRQQCEVCWIDIGLGNGLGRLPNGAIGPRPADCLFPVGGNCVERGGRDGGPCRDIKLNDCPKNPITPDDPPVGGGIGVTGISTPPVTVRPPGGGSVTGVFVPPIGLPPFTSLTGIQAPPGFIDDNIRGGNGRDGQFGIFGFGGNLGIDVNQYLNSFSNNKNMMFIDLDQEAQNSKIAHEDKEVKSIYHREYNLFQYSINKTVEFVDNTKYLNLFKERVPKEITYAINVNSTSGIWKEYPYSQITKEKIIYALRPEVLRCISNLHFQNSKKIPIDYFIETILRLLVLGRLDDFDFDFYKNLADRQSSDVFIEFKSTQNNNFKEQAALGIVSQYAVTVDPNLAQNVTERNRRKRSRRLNTDIEAKIPVTDFDNVVYPIPVVDAGIFIEVADPGVPVDSGGAQSFAPLGDGHGYYLSAVLDTNETIALKTQNILSSTFYIPPGIRDQVLNLFNVDSSTKLRTTCPSGMSEFDSDYDLNTVLGPMYFSLDLSSTGDLTRHNPLIRAYSGTYSLQTDQEVIDNHTKNYGLNITKIYLDFNDPFLVYALKSGKVSFEQNDISFANVEPNRTAHNSQVLSRHIDFGIILIPTKGSKFNPFFGTSKLLNFTSPFTREISVITNIDKSDSEPLQISLKEENLANLTGERKIGLLEEENAYNIIYKYDATSIQYSTISLSSGVYGSTFPAREKPSFGKMVSDVIETTLDDNYGPLSSITWWDVFRRLTLKDIADLAINTSQEHLQQLASGSRGYKIRHVLQRENMTGTLLSGDGDSVILNLEDRGNPSIYA